PGVLRDPRSKGPRAAVLAHHPDAVTAVGGDRHGVAVHLDVRTVLDQDLGAPEPGVETQPVVPRHVVADHRGVADLVLDAALGVPLHQVVLVERVDVVDVGPETGAGVVVHVVVAHN